MEYTPEQLKIIEKINKMSHIEMAKIYRFALIGHPYFDEKLPYNKHFMKRFKEFGGLTSEISKLIGWSK
jgi:hypothetical protein